MKNIFYSFCAVIVSMTFMACPYKSEVALDAKPTEKVNAALLGTYEKKNSSTYIYKLEKESDMVYKITEVSTKTKKEKEYFGYTSTINGQQYLQTYTIPKYESSKKYFYVYRLTQSKSGSSLTLDPVTKNIKEKFNTGPAFKDFISKHQSLSFFFEKPEKYYRAD